MSTEWFADVTGRKRIEIPEIDGWIECRQELSVGELRSIFNKAFKGQVALEDGQVRNEYDWREISLGQTCAYIVDWSHKTECTPDAIRALKPDVYGFIEAAVEKHIKAIQKNAPTAETKKAKRNAAPTSISAVS